MVNQKKTQGKSNFADIELWAFARVVTGQTIPDDLPIGEEAYKLLRDLGFVSLEWREQTFQQRAGVYAMHDIQQWINAPMPVYQVGPGINYSPAPAYGAPPPPMAIPQRQHLIYADELKRLPSPKYALETYPIYQQCLNALVGPSGAGKSFIAVDIAGRMAVQGTTVIYIAGEGLFGYSARWEVWKAHRRLTNCPNLIFFDNPVNFMEAGELQKFMDEIVPKKPSMIIVDTVARCMVGADENSTRDMGMFVGACDRLIHTLGVGVLAVHHTGKDGKMRGNTSLFGACDSVLFLRRDQQDITVYNSLDMGGKNKNNQEADPLRLTLLPQQVEVEGKTFDSAILVDSYQVIADEQTAQLKAREYTLLEVIEPYENGLKVEAICDATNIPRASAYRTLSTLKKNGLLVEMNEKYSLTDEGRNALSDR